MLQLRIRKNTDCCSLKRNSKDDSTDQTPLNYSTSVKLDLNPETNEDSNLQKQCGGEKLSSLPTLLMLSKQPSGVCFTPSGKLIHFWGGIITLWVVYHMWVIIYRYAFAEVNSNNLIQWFILDYSADFIYIVDMIVSLRTGFLEDGVMQYNSKRMRIHYFNSTQFYIDCLCLLPFDILYLSIGFNSMLRIFRMCKIYKFWQFLDRVERHASFPNIMRAAKLTFYYLTILHWNACVTKLMVGCLNKSMESFEPYWNDLVSNQSIINRSKMNNGSASAASDEYVAAFYWGMLSLFSIGLIQKPVNTADYMFQIAQRIVGILLFATILGHVSNIITHISAGQKEFQARLDRVKHYLSLRRVPDNLQARVFDWFDYLWYTNKITDEDNVLNNLPDKLKAEIAIQTHLDTLKRVEMFQNTEEGFLSELVLRLRIALFAPGDFVCRKGEIGKHMFIVNRGTLHVLADDNRTILATLHAGSYFGELSILNLGQYGNRRSASVRSLGYSDLFRLSKSDLWDVLKEYPGARRKLEEHAYKKIDTFKMPLLGKVNDADPNTNDHFSGSNDEFDSFNRKSAPHNQSTYQSNHLGNINSSDGYGSDPNHVSAAATSPQQSPTPPINLQSNHNLHAISRIPTCLENISSKSISAHWNSLSGDVDKIRPTTCACLPRETPYNVTRHSTCTYVCASNENQEVPRRKSVRNISVPVNVLGQPVLCVVCLKNQQGRCAKCHRRLRDSVTKDAILTNTDETNIACSPTTYKDIDVSSYCSLEPRPSSIPTICLEKASTTSSSCSPCSSNPPQRPIFTIDNRDEFDTVNNEKNSIQNGTNSCISVAHDSKCTWLPLQPIRTTPSLFSYTADMPDVIFKNKEQNSMISELSRLQHRVRILEAENAALLHNGKRKLFIPSVERESPGMDTENLSRHDSFYGPEEDLNKDTRLIVKRANSLKVPSVSISPKCHYKPINCQNFNLDQSSSGNESVSPVMHRRCSSDNNTQNKSQNETKLL